MIDPRKIDASFKPFLLRPGLNIQVATSMMGPDLHKWRKT